MKITKIGHCCLLIKENGVTILTDPGMFSTGQDELTGIDVVIITHEHQDHFHIDSLKRVLKNNPKAKVITNGSVGKLLDKEQIQYQIVAHGGVSIINNVFIEGFGTTHAEIYKEIPSVENTGYFINKKLFYPGDALYNPERTVEILALPICGPWLKISEVIEYAVKINPKKAFPVHDALLNEKSMPIYSRAPQKFLEAKGISFQVLDLGKEVEL